MISLELFWAASCLILTLSYISNLRAALIAVQYEPSIDSNEDVALFRQPV